MRIKEVKFNQDAKLPLIKGINTVCDAVATTMGYRGRYVLIESPGGLPIVTKDGVSVAESITLEDGIESLGAEFVKQACKKTLSETGDATTCTAVLTKSIIEECEKQLNSGASAIDIKNGVEKAVKDVVDHIVKYSRPVDDDYIFDVAKISSNNDSELGEIIAKAFIKAGKNGVVSYEQSDNMETYLDFIDGMPISRGWEFEGFVNKPKTRTVEFADAPKLLLSNRKFQNIREILPIIEHCHRANQELLIISEMEYEVMKVLYANKKNGLKVGVITPPSIGEKRRDYLSDIALATDALVVDLDTSTNLEAYDPEAVLGSCSKLIVSKDDTVLFFAEKINPEEIESKISELEEVINSSTNKLEIEYLKDRISKLACGVSIVKVGGTTEVELKEKIDRVDDAINAVKSAISEGVVAGGGVVLCNFERPSSTEYLTNDEKKGYDVLCRAIEAPIRTILTNAESNPEEVISFIRGDKNRNVASKSIDMNMGYDVKDFKYKDMFKAGIIDPAKSIRVALQNAASVAMTVLLTNTTVTHKRDEGSSK